MAIGQDMRIKVKLYFQKPLMRGVTLDLGMRCGRIRSGAHYSEFLHDFCYACGVISHIDRMCEMQLEKGVVQ